MRDIIKRLTDLEQYNLDYQECYDLRTEAAEEIEQLEIKISDLTTENGDQAQTIEWLEREVSALTAAHGDLFKKLLAHQAQAAAMREALEDMLSGWRYIRQQHGDLYGVGWDRSESKADTALSTNAGSEMLRVVATAETVVKKARERIPKSNGVITDYLISPEDITNLCEALASLESGQSSKEGQ